MYSGFAGLILIAFMLVWSSPTSTPSFKPLFKPIKVQLNKKHPPSIAFQDSLKFIQNEKKSMFDDASFVSLQTDEKKHQSWTVNKTVILASMVITQQEAKPTPFVETYESRRWLASAVPQEIEKNVSKELKTILRSANPKEIIGHLQIQGGLAVLNTSRIEVRRVFDGVEQDLGNVNIHDGTYSIELSDRRGLLIGKLIDQTEKVWGEGQIRLEQVQWQSMMPQQGPNLTISPRAVTQHNLVTPYTQDKGKNRGPQRGAQVLAMNGAATAEISKEGGFSFDDLNEKSTTLVRYIAEGYTPTQQIFSPGMTDKAMIMPSAMMASLKSIVSEQKQYNMYDPQSPIIWGQVLRDGNSMEGIRVEMDSHPEFEVVYFNEFYLPDNNRNTTSKNGYFAIIDPPPGFQSLVAYQGETLFSYQNTVVDEGSVSYVELQNTIKTKDTNLKVFNAFTGAGEESIIQLQSALEKKSVNQQAIIQTQEINRLAILQSSPNEKYVNADYLYNEKDDFIHVPLFQKDWIGYIMQQQRINQSTMKAIVIGLVPEDDFEISAQFEGQENLDVVYFDSRGELVSGGAGKMGGGFILFNAPTDVFELGVRFSKNKDQILSKVLPARPGEFLVSTFRE